MKFTIRKISHKDKDEFMAMSRAFYASDAVLHPIDDKHHEDAFWEMVASQRYLDCLFFEAGKNILGYALLAKSYSREAGGLVIWIDELYVKPEYRDQGIGKSVLNWMEKVYPAARYRLELEQNNVNAAKLYEKMGYRPLPYVQMVKDAK